MGCCIELTTDRGADGSTAALGAGDSDSVSGSASGEFDSQVSDFLNLKMVVEGWSPKFA